MSKVFLLLLLVILGLIIFSIVILYSKDIPGFKIMLLGINITLFGGIFALNSNLNLGVIEFLIAFIGLIISFVGLLKKD